MLHETWELIVQSLGNDRRLFHYFPGYETVYLLERLTRPGPRSLVELRRGPYGGWLDRPVLRPVLRLCGDGQLSAERLLAAYPREYLTYRISWSVWSQPRRHKRRWAQLSRPGYNLVLQLNFDAEHNRAFRSLHDSSFYCPFRCYWHPARADDEYTLAWARIDLSDDLSTALIEEIQSDWWRMAQNDIVRSQHGYRDEQGVWQEEEVVYSYSYERVELLEEYLENVLRPRAEYWAEATLTAALRLLWEEIGVERIYYHTYESGLALKRCRPPRSLYAKLPRRFGFQPTREPPDFLADALQEQPLPFWRWE